MVRFQFDLYRATRMLVAGALSTVAVPGLALAGYAIYVSPDDSGNPPASLPTFEVGGTADYPVYIVSDEGQGDSGSEKCSGNGTGNEVCAWLASFSASGGVSIDDFLPGDADVVINLASDNKSMKANGLDVVEPAPGPSRMGTLRLSATGPGELEILAGEGVGSQLTIASATPAVLARATEVASGCPGDANADGLTDGADYTIWADNYSVQTTSGATAGDFNGDGEVDGADYTIWADNFGCGEEAGGAGAVMASHTPDDTSGGGSASQTPACGLGFEAGLALIGLAALRRRRPAAV